MTHTIRTLADLRATAKTLDNYFFTRGAMRAFDSRIESGVYRVDDTNGFFVSSEQFHGTEGSAPRSYRVRRYEVQTRPDGSQRLEINTDGSEHTTRAAAMDTARQAAADERHHLGTR